MTINYKNASIKNSNPIFFITPNPNRAMGLEGVIKNYFVICSQKSDAVDYFKKNKIAVLCLNDNEIKNSGKILFSKKVVEHIKKKSKNKKANIISFKPSPMIQKICDENSFNYLGNDWKLNRDLEDKIKFVEITKKLKIPNTGSKIIKLEKNKYPLNFSKNKKFIIQLPRGFSGNSTFLIESKNDFDKILKKYENRKVKLSKYFEGETYTINACIAENKILIGKPIFQITGFSAYNKNSFGTCGNDYVYYRKLKKEQRKKIFDYTKKVGGYLKKIGYKGIFGLDFIASESGRREARLPIGSLASRGVDLIEINPRLIASVPVFTKLQIQDEQPPFLLLHILEFLTSSSSPLLRREKKMNFIEWDKKNNFNASQLILRNVKNNSVKIKESLASGIYEIKKNKLVFKKEAYSAEKKMKKNEFLVQCSAKGRMVSPDIEYANIQVGYGIMENEKEFKDDFEKIACLIMKNIEISNC